MANTKCAVVTPNISSAFLSKEGNELLSSIKAPRYVDYINLLFGRVFAKEYVNENSFRSLSDFNTDKDSDSINGNLIKLYNKVQDELKLAINSEEFDIVPDETSMEVMKVLENWDLFVKYHSKYNAFVSIDDSFSTTEDKEFFDRVGNEYNEFELVSNQVLTLFKFLPKAVSTTSPTGENIIVEGIDPYDKLAVRSDFANVFKLTLDALKGIKDETEFINKLTSPELLKKIPELQFLFEILPIKNDGIKTLSPKQRLLFNSLYITFSRDYVPVFLSSASVPEDGADILPIHKRFKATKGNAQKVLAKFISNFTSNQSENEFAKKDTEENLENPELSGFGIKRLFSLPAKPKMIEINEQDLNDMSIKNILSKYKEYIDYYKVLGVEFSDLSLISKNEDKRNLINILNYTRNIHDNLQQRLTKGDKILSPLANITKQVDGVNPETKKTFKILNLRDIVNKIVAFEGEFSKLEPTVMSKGASGESRSDITYSNALSIAAQQISTAKSMQDLYNKSYFKKLMYNPLHKGSFVANNILGTDAKYEIENYSGHVQTEEKDEKKLDTRDLSASEKFISDFNNLLGYGTINTPQLESKSGYFAIKFQDKFGNPIFPVANTDMENGFMSNDNSKFSQQIYNYLRGELKRIEDYKSLKNATYRVPETYGKLHIFAGMLTEAEIEELNSKTWSITDPIIQNMKPKIEQFFQDQLVSMKNFIKNNNINNFISSNVLSKQGITEELNKNSKDYVTDLLLRTFISNDFVHNVEFGIYISGDPLFFKDWHKRLGGLASTGTTPANTENIRLLFQSDQEKTFWDNFSLRGILNQQLEQPVQRRDNSDTLLSAVMTEDTINSGTAYHGDQILEDYIHSVQLVTGKVLTTEEAKKILKTEGLSLDKGDGEGYLNLDAHRELSIRQDRYRPQHDVSYRFEALTFKRDILKVPLTKEETELYNREQAQILRDPDKYALPILKQTYYGTMANPNIKIDAKVFDKFSLFPLLPSITKNHPELRELLSAMANRQISYVKYKSGTKGYVKDTFDTVKELFDETRELDLLQSDLLKLQILPSKVEKKKTKIPTQDIKLRFANMFDRGQSTPAIEKQRQEFLDNLNAIKLQNKAEVMSKLGFTLGKDGKISKWDKKKIIKSIVQQVNSQKLPSNLLEAFETDAEGNFVNTIESSGVFQLLSNYITGQLDSSLREFKMNGGDFVLISDSKFKDPLRYSRLNADKTAIENIDVRITLTKEFSKMLNLPDPKDVSRTISTIERLNELIKDQSFVDKYKKELSITFSRPPVQSQNSMGVGTVVEFFYPTAGNVLVLPIEFMHQAGIDFDYDKEKVLLPTLSSEGVYLGEENIQSRLEEMENEYQELREIYDYLDSYLEASEEFADYEAMRKSMIGTDAMTQLILDVLNVKAVQELPEKLDDLITMADEYVSARYKQKSIVSNNLLESMIKGLQLPEQFHQLVLPNTDGTVKPLAKTNGQEINNVNTLPIGNSVYTYQENLKVFKMFNDAKALLGPFALQNVFSQLIAPLNVELSLDYNLNKEGLPQSKINNIFLKDKSRTINISKRENEAEESLQSLLSEFINATVDSAKDPYFSNFMLSFDNISTFMFMLTLGYPVKTIVDYTSSAIVRKYLDNKNKFSNLKMEDLVNKTLAEIGDRTDRTVLTKKSILALDASTINDETVSNINLKTLKDNDSLNKEALFQDHSTVLFNFITMGEHAKEFSKFKSLFDNDTNKVTSAFEIYTKSELKQDVISKGMFSTEDITNIEEKSTMTAFRNDPVIADVMKTVFPLMSNRSVVIALGELFKDRKSSMGTNDSMLMSQIITNDFIASILYTYGEYNGRNIFEYGKDLIRKEKKEDGTFNITLLERLDNFKKNKEYAKLIEAFPVLDKIVGQVSSEPIRGNPIYHGTYAFNITLNVDPSTPLFQKESFMTQFKSLLEGNFETKDPKVKENLIKFVKDFFIAGLTQTGLNSGAISFNSYAPIDFIQSLLNPALEQYKNLQPNELDAYLNKFYGKFKLNNSKFFYLSERQKASVVRSSYLGKDLRIVPDAKKEAIQPPPKAKIEKGEPEVTKTTEVKTTTEKSFTYKGKTIETEFVLGEQQVQALRDLIDYALQSKVNQITLQGAAGTGKTSIIGYLQKYLGYEASFAFMAPTHAATAELAFATVKTGNNILPATLQSATRLNPKTGKHVFSAKILQRLIGTNPIVVLDESSMIDASDMIKIDQSLRDIGGKVIYLGDMKQISKVTTDNKETKLVSPAFVDPQQIMLTKIFRQSDNSLLNLLSKMREQNDFKLFKVPDSDKVKFLDRTAYNQELIAELKNNPENTVIISYTNNSVKSINLAARKILGRAGETIPGDIVVGYLGYASKQIEKGDIANSISYTIKQINELGPEREIVAVSDKLEKLANLGIAGITGRANTIYYQLDANDSLTFDNLTKEDFEKNNKTVSGVFRNIYDATIKYNSKMISYGDYLSTLASANDTLRKVSVGNTYIYNPATNRMEIFNAKTHFGIKSTGQGSLKIEKDIDYGHAITIHKSQGATIDNVYFDSSSLSSAQNTPIIDLKGNRITTEKQSLAYVAMSRSKNKLVVYEGDNHFEMLGVEPAKTEEKISKPAEKVVPLPKVNPETGEPLVEPTNKKVMLKDFVNHSGGAQGADIAWDNIGKEFGFVNNKHYFTGEKGPQNAPNGNTKVEEDSLEYQEGKVEAAKAAAVTYGYQYGAMKDARLIRNWSQVKNADAVFAIGTIVGVGKPLFPNIPNDTRLAKVVAVTGGTGYAVQMAINNNKPVYIFDQSTNQWAKNIDGVWSRMTEIPTLTKNFAGIGSRNITQAGKDAIKTVFENTLKTVSTNTEVKAEAQYLKDDKRIRIDYPDMIETQFSSFSSQKLIELTKIKFDGSNIAEESELLHNYSDAIFKKYGKPAAQYVFEANTELSVNEAEFLKNNPQFATQFMTSYLEDVEAEGTLMQEYAEKLLLANRVLVDTAQLDLFLDNEKTLGFKPGACK